MTTSGAPPTPLSGVRVVDITEDDEALAGRVLGMLGAGVDRIRPPLDEARLRAQLGSADVLIHSRTTTGAASVGLDPDTLLSAYPALVVAAITPYGYDGPRADAPATDLTVQASSGLMALIGDPDRPPLPVPGRQAACHAGAQAAGDIVAALCERQSSGRGQFLDVSMQTSMLRSLLGAASWPVVRHRDQPGAGDDRARPREVLPGLFVPRVAVCRDGYVLPAVVGTAATGGGTNSTLAELLRWWIAAGGEPGEYDPEDYVGWEERVGRGELSPDQVLQAVDRAFEVLGRLTKRELLTRALDQQLPLAPVLEPADLFSDEQLADRGFWRKDGEGRLYPGHFARLSRTSTRTATVSDPARDARTADLTAAPRIPRNLSEVRVADFTWAGVGPLATKWLADHGATVVHVESANRLDTLRRAGAPWPSEPGPDRSHFFSNYNTSKLGITLDLRRSDGRAVAARLADWADVVVESYTPGVLRRLGVDLDRLREKRPELITASTSLRGSTGRGARMRGYGSAGAALSGLHAVTGWPDRPPCGPGIAYTDSIAPKYLFTALAAAIYERSRDGLGQHIDLSQVEASITFLEPQLLRVQSPSGPAGQAPPVEPGWVLPAAGVERYLSVAPVTAEQADAAWRVVTGGGPAGGWAGDLRTAVAAWARDRDAFAAADQLIAAGVPAAAVQRPSDLHRDPQLAHRGYFVELDHPQMGRIRHDGCATRYSRTAPTPRRAGPILGQHNERVLGEFLGYSPEQIRTLAADGALT